jgi:hypothetical protein
MMAETIQVEEEQSDRSRYPGETSKEKHRTILPQLPVFLFFWPYFRGKWYAV